MCPQSVVSFLILYTDRAFCSCQAHSNSGLERNAITYLTYVFLLMCPELKVGQYVTSQVEEVKNEGRVVRLSGSRPAVGQACAESTQGWNLTNLLPGLLVKATITKVEATFSLVMSFSHFY